MTRTYFPQTTPSQRRLLFETWEAGGDIGAACRTAHVGERTYYYWKPRFVADGYAGLEHFASRAPHHPPRCAPGLEQRVVTLYQEHDAWGKQRLADELAKENGWVPVVSPNTIKRILKDAGLWQGLRAAGEKRGPVA